MKLLPSFIEFSYKCLLPFLLSQHQGKNLWALNLFLTQRYRPNSSTTLTLNSLGKATQVYYLKNSSILKAAMAALGCRGVLGSSSMGQAGQSG